MKTESQNKRIYAYLKRGNIITPIIAFNLFGCLRLSARIYDIKESLEGSVQIQTNMIKVSNQTYVASYKLIKS